MVTLGRICEDFARITCANVDLGGGGVDRRPPWVGSRASTGWQLVIFKNLEFYVSKSSLF